MARLLTILTLLFIRHSIGFAIEITNPRCQDEAAAECGLLESILEPNEPESPDQVIKNMSQAIKKLDENADYWATQEYFDKLRSYRQVAKTKFLDDKISNMGLFFKVLLNHLTAENGRKFDEACPQSITQTCKLIIQNGDGHIPVEQLIDWIHTFLSHYQGEEFLGDQDFTLGGFPLSIVAMYERLFDNTLADLTDYNNYVEQNIEMIEKAWQDLFDHAQKAARILLNPKLVCGPDIQRYCRDLEKLSEKPEYENPADYIKGADRVINQFDPQHSQRVSQNYLASKKEFEAINQRYESLRAAYNEAADQIRSTFEVVQSSIKSDYKLCQMNDDLRWGQHCLVIASTGPQPNGGRSCGSDCSHQNTSAFYADLPQMVEHTKAFYRQYELANGTNVDLLENRSIFENALKKFEEKAHLDELLKQKNAQSDILIAKLADLSTLLPPQ